MKWFAIWINCFGGLPEVMITYIRIRNFNGTQETRKQLLNDYKEDIAKYVECLRITALDKEAQEDLRANSNPAEEISFREPEIKRGRLQNIRATLDIK